MATIYIHIKRLVSLAARDMGNVTDTYCRYLLPAPRIGINQWYAKVHGIQNDS